LILDQNGVIVPNETKNGQNNSTAQSGQVSQGNSTMQATNVTSNRRMDDEDELFEIDPQSDRLAAQVTAVHVLSEVSSFYIKRLINE